MFEAATHSRAMEILRRRRVRNLVRELYRAILGRQPDRDGARAYESLVLELGAETAVPRILKAFLDSSEYRERDAQVATSYVNATLASKGEQLVNGQPIHHLASLGNFCLPSITLQKNGLRRYSLPFDWIFSTPQLVRDCLADDFAVFLDRQYYRSIDGPSGELATAEHEFYRHRYGISGLFAHHDPTRESDYLYLVRCVARFRQLMHSEATKLFVVVGRGHHDLPTEFPLLVEALTRVTQNFAVLCVELLDPGEPGLSTTELVARTGDHALYRFTPSAFNSVGAFLPDKLDEWALLRLVYRYKLALKDTAWSGADSALPAEVASRVSTCA